MELIGYGQKWGRWGQGESFVMTREVAGGIPLDDLLRQRFAKHSTRRLRQSLRALLGQVALMTRRLHLAGYNHRDLYCCHFLVCDAADFTRWETGDPADSFRVHLIDLQRVQYRRWYRHRWIVKDLAQMNYSAPREAVSRSDRLRFFMAYLQVERLGARDRRLIHQILAKTARIARHDGRSRGQRA
jgi:heptose I phosphotransferase